RWGTEEGVRELLGPHTTSVTMTRRMLKARSRSLDAWFDGMSKWFGPLKTVYDGLPDQDRGECQRRMIALASEFNRSGDERLHAPAEYLEIVAVR
ncbi:MAG: hypothetical protein JNL98_23680, partial [Bryobacterales bacterium]|nr:hypothetical protein [Bryobacterales bacterium]